MFSTLAIESVTPAQAAEWLSFNTMNRPVRQAHVDFLASEMRQGRFANTAEIHLFATEGKRFVSNGQHTMLAIIEYGQPVQVTVRRSSGTSDELKVIMTVGHDKGIARTTHDSFVFYGADNDPDIVSSHINKMAAAIRFAKRNFGVTAHAVGRVSDIYIIETLPAWKPEYLKLRDAIMPCTSDMRNSIMRSDALSVALLTFYFQPQKAHEFWSGVASGANLDKYDPRLRANQYLVAARYNPNRHKSEGGNVTSRKIIYAWNRFFEGSELVRLPGIDAKGIVSISGTGTYYTGKQPGNLWPTKKTIETVSPAW